LLKKKQDTTIVDGLGHLPVTQLSGVQGRWRYARSKATGPTSKQLI